MKNNLLIALLLFTAFVRVGWCDASGATTMYIQAIKVDIKKEPKMNSALVASAKRGNEVTVLETQGTWQRVKVAGTEGWVSKLFLSVHKPIGKADLARDISSDSLEKASRRRSSSYVVSAAARGLMAGERGREGREMYLSDYKALEKMEAYSVGSEKQDKFRAAAKIGD